MGEGGGKKFARSNIKLGDMNSLKLHGLRELVVMGKTFIAVIVWVWLFRGMILRTYPESYQRQCPPNCHG